MSIFGPSGKCKAMIAPKYSHKSFVEKEGPQGAERKLDEVPHDPPLIYLRPSPTTTICSKDGVVKRINNDFRTFYLSWDVT